MGPSPPVPETLQALALSLYRLAAKVIGVWLGRHEIVESVYAHRSVATGEVSFGRSDIDLMIVVRPPESASADGPELASLYERVQLLRRLHPALTHVQMHDPRGLEKWLRTDTYRGSTERRSALLLAGKPAAMPSVTVRREDAVRWFAFYPAHFFSTAVRERNPRNLRKIATEMWSAYAVAQGRTPEPDLTRKQAEARARIEEDGAGLAELASYPERAPDFVFGLAKRLHDGLLPPLEPLREPFVFRAPLAPRSRLRVFVIPPGPGYAPPAEAFEADSFLATPELLHLCSHYVNPFAAWGLPPELSRLGFVRPSPKEYVRACLFYLQDNTLRNVGFAHRDTWVAGATVAVVAHSIPYLRNGEIPPPMQAQNMQALLEHQPSVADFYREEFGRIYSQSQGQLEVLEELERRLG